jgi:hypothetical protein
LYAIPLPGGLLPALVIGGPFALIMLGLVAYGLVGMARTAPPRAPKAKRAKAAALQPQPV